VSRAQNVWTVSTLAATAVAFMLLLFLSFSFWISFAIAALAFFIVSGIGYRYFLKHATPQEIREDLEARKNSPG
jgi:membrane protein implicated in regulation of membrane protease activity